MRGFGVRSGLWEMMGFEWDVEQDPFASGGEGPLSIGIVPGIARGLWFRL